MVNLCALLFLVSILGGGVCQVYKKTEVEFATSTKNYKVYKKPELSLQPSEQKVVRQAGKGNSYFMRCRGTAGKLRWRHIQDNEEKDISTSTLDRVHSEVSKSGLDLVFGDIQNEDEGRYICENIQGYKVFFEMLVIQPIDFGSTPHYQPVLFGQTSHRLICNVKGHPFPTVTWKAKGKNIWNKASNHPHEKYEMDGTSLIIKDISKSDQGKYLCKAVQIVEEEVIVKESSFKEIVIKFKIEQKPSWITSASQDQFYGYVTGKANMTCEAFAEPPANFTWTENHLTGHVMDGAVFTKDHKSTLQIPVDHHNIFGAYKCIAQNIHGRISKVVHLTEGAKPGTPYIEIYKIFADGIMLRIQEPQAEMFLKVKGFQVEYKEVNKSWNESHLSELKLTSSIYLLQGLNPKTLYDIRARSRNKAGLSDPSNVIFIKTNSPSAQALNRSSMSGMIQNTELLILLLAMLKIVSFEVPLQNNMI